MLKREEKRIMNPHSSLLRFIKWVIGYIEAYYNLFVVNCFKKYPRNKSGVTGQKRKQKIIISLTSFPKRIDKVWITIETLLRQSMKPDEIILWLAKEQFSGLNSLPEQLLNQQKRGVTIRFCDDLRSHKKYYYVMQEHPEDLIILVDDDMFYPSDTVEKLMKMHKKFPNDICTMTAQVIVPSFTSNPSLWRNPFLEERFEHSDDVQIFTGSGSIYPPDSLDKEVFNKELIMNLCQNADDLWLTFMANKKNTKITAQYPWRAFPVTIYGTTEGSLWYINAEQGQNDKQWQQILDYFFGRS